MWSRIRPVPGKRRKGYRRLAFSRNPFTHTAARVTPGLLVTGLVALSVAVPGPPEPGSTTPSTMDRGPVELNLSAGILGSRSARADDSAPAGPILRRGIPPRPEHLGVDPDRGYEATPTPSRDQDAGRQSDAGDARVGAPPKRPRRTGAEGLGTHPPAEPIRAPDHPIRPPRSGILNDSAGQASPGSGIHPRPTHGEDSSTPRKPTDAGPSTRRTAAGSTDDSSQAGESHSLRPSSSAAGHLPSQKGDPRGMGMGRARRASGDEDEKGFILRIRDNDEILRNHVPVVILTSGAHERHLYPKDDGSSPDTSAGDGIWSLGVAAVSTPVVDIVLREDDPEGPVLGRGRVRFEGSEGERELTIELSASGIQLIAGNQKEHRADGFQGAFLHNWARVFWLLIAAALAGFGIRAAGRRSGAMPLHLERAGRGTGFHPFGPEHPGVDDGHTLWRSAPGAMEELSLKLAESLTTRGTVLLLPHAASRDALKAALAPSTLDIWMGPVERPSPRAVLRAASALDCHGRRPLSIVIEGRDALEAARRDPNATLEILLERSRWPIFLVWPVDEPTPRGIGAETRVRDIPMTPRPTSLRPRGTRSAPLEPRDHPTSKGAVA